ncbi:MAG: hypothetical protein GY795_30365 [Desulfobacterales bacterium]|nr:hypothetical protein [Desulfobacterales bacterium]
MEITIRFPDEIGKRIIQLPDIDGFIITAVTDALKNQADRQSISDSEPSRWAKIAQRVQNDPVHLEGYSEQLKRDMKEFREHFEFIHDYGL